MYLPSNVFMYYLYLTNGRFFQAISAIQKLDPKFDKVCTIVLCVTVYVCMYVCMIGCAFVYVGDMGVGSALDTCPKNFEILS